VLVVNCGLEVPAVTTGIYARVNGVQYELYRNRIGATLDARFFSSSVTISLDSNGGSIAMYLEASFQNTGSTGFFYDAYMDVMEVAR
jgi:hypothetical protein